MRELTYYVAVTLDGRIAGPEHQIDAFGFPPELAKWIVENVPETLPAPARTAMGLVERPNVRFDTVIMGRSTYELGLKQGLSSPYPHLRQIVVSSTLPADVDTDVEVVRELDATRFDAVVGPEGSGVWLCGGGLLAASLRDRIDTLVLKRQPLILGSGRPLFHGTYQPRTLARVEQITAGPVLIETFRRS